MAELAKNEQMSVRTTLRNKRKLKRLSDRVDAHKWEFPHDSAIQNCASMSGIVHELTAENITIPQIKKHLSIVEEK